MDKRSSENASSRTNAPSPHDVSLVVQGSPLSPLHIVEAAPQKVSSVCVAHIETYTISAASTLLSSRNVVGSALCFQPDYRNESLNADMLLSTSPLRFVHASVFEDRAGPDTLQSPIIAIFVTINGVDVEATAQGNRNTKVQHSDVSRIAM